MTNFDQTLRQFRLKLHGLHILIEAERGRHTEGWFAGVEPEHEERGEATKRLVERGLLEPQPPPSHYGVTETGRRLLANVRAKIAPNGRVDWTRIDETDFPLM